MCIRDSHLQQRECHHETHDQPFHYTDDPDIDSQFLRNECGYPSGRDAVCLCTDYPVLRRAVDISVYRIPENQVVLIQATAIQAVLNLPLRQRHKKAACHS